MHKIPPEAMAAARRSSIREALMELLIKEKKEALTIKCGLRALDQIMHMPELTYITGDSYIRLAGCYIEVEKDFELEPWNIVHDDKVIFK